MMCNEFNCTFTTMNEILYMITIGISDENCPASKNENGTLAVDKIINCYYEALCEDEKKKNSK